MVTYSWTLRRRVKHNSLSRLWQEDVSASVVLHNASACAVLLDGLTRHNVCHNALALSKHQDGRWNYRTTHITPTRDALCSVSVEYHPICQPCSDMPWPFSQIHQPRKQVSSWAWHPCVLEREQLSMFRYLVIQVQVSSYLCSGILVN